MGKPEAAQLIELINACPQRVNKGYLINWLFKKWQNVKRDSFSYKDLGKVTYHFSESRNWIRTDQLFLTIVSKREHQPSDLISVLLDALYSWAPSPHHLLMSKFRSEIDNKGIIGESAPLNNKHVLYGWLKDLMDDGAKDQIKLVKKTFVRHWEALGDRIQRNTEQFSLNLMQALRSETIENLCEKFGLAEQIKDKANVLKWTNYYSSNKTFDRSHLTTGHILEIKENGNNNYWVCLSPACDLVPGQKKSFLGENFLPFIGVKLHSNFKEEEALERANENIFTFLQINGEIKCFSLHNGGAHRNPPVAEQMFVDGIGLFHPENCELSVMRIVSNVDDAGHYLRANKVTAKVIGQLRYEYALNLLQRLGGSLSRIGLDYKSYNS